MSIYAWSAYLFLSSNKKTKTFYVPNIDKRVRNIETREYQASDWFVE